MSPPARAAISGCGPPLCGGVWVDEETELPPKKSEHRFFHPLGVVAGASVTTGRLLRVIAGCRPASPRPSRPGRPSRCPRRVCLVPRVPGSSHRPGRRLRRRFARPSEGFLEGTCSRDVGRAERDERNRLFHWGSFASPCHRRALQPVEGDVDLLFLRQHHFAGCSSILFRGSAVRRCNSAVVSCPHSVSGAPLAIS
jgi:hypothetical protein